ncbi:hypothetical protein GCM10011581_25950 [Saccharopolyspora subtropica]|uniref:Uncharacterized protein n=1 Tax=Saccharopolyspora thermophila TaxID=89367 RepID=A0A917JXJ1_9PSEU|nr:hypothetical protein [Saccharopolyspora subtropica]GGI87700.1 hypothetical protein GCM10011581_25950 [Saccharopolyspora subtropica]
MRHLVERIEAETGNSARHGPGEPVSMRGDLADDIANEQTRILPLPPEVLAAKPDEVARNPLVLQRVLAGVRRL